MSPTVPITRLPHEDGSTGDQSELHAHTNVLCAGQCIVPLHLYEPDRAHAEKRVGAHDALGSEGRHGGIGRIRLHAISRE